MLKSFLEYKKQADTFACYDSASYPYFLLVEEVGELIGKFGKIERGDPKTKNLEVYNLEIAKEIGDVFWALSQLYNYHTTFEPVNTDLFSSTYEILAKLSQQASEVFNDYILCYIPLKGTQIFNLLILLCEKLGFEPVFVMNLNIEKLTDRKNRGVIKGSGDNR